MEKIQLDITFREMVEKKKASNDIKRQNNCNVPLKLNIYKP